MGALSWKQLLDITGGKARGNARRPLVERVSIDSRAVQPGDLFVCLPGDRFDGHAFAADAAHQGARALLVERELPVALPQVCVPSSLAALGALGRFARRGNSNALVIGITGTNGKTGTKDLTLAALGASRRSVGSRASFNNAVGVPLTLLDMGPDTEALVVELGTNHPGEIAALTALVEPEVGVVTNVHAGHLEGLGSLVGVRAEKGSLLAGLVGRRVSVLNRDDPSFTTLSAMAPGEVLSFGLSPESDLRATDVRCSLTETRFRLVDGAEGREVVLRHLGRHAVLNGLAALAVARVAGVDFQTAVEALAQVPPPPGRLQIRQTSGVTLLDDSYNANPGSVAAAAATVAEIGHPGRRVFVVGDMLELGETAHELHRAAGRSLAQCFPQRLLAVGRYARDVIEGAVEIGLDRALCTVCSDRDEARAALKGTLRRGDLVLVKGSRRTGLDRLLDGLSVSAPEPELENEAAVAP